MAMIPNGTIIYAENHPKTGRDIWLLPPGEEPIPWLVTPAFEGEADVSPDGRLVAFTSNVSGRFEVYVAAFEGESERVPVSTTGGARPRWAPAGDRVFFRDGNRLMSSGLSTDPGLVAADPELVFDGGWELSNWAESLALNYSPMPDGWFLMVYHRPAAVPTRINVIFNWFEELERLVPTD